MNEMQSDPLKDWARLTEKNTENALAKSLFNSILLSSKSFDVFSSWLLLITGAILTLLISNLDPIRNIANSFTVTLFLFLMLASAIFGVIAKYFSIMIEVLYNISKAIENEFPQILDGFNSEKEKIKNVAKENNREIDITFDFTKVLSLIIEQYPKLFHKFFWKSAKKGENDPLLNHKNAIKYLMRRSIYVTIQIILLTAGLLFFVKNIIL